MSEVKQDRLDAEFTQAIGEVTAADLTSLIPFVEAFGLAGDLDTVIRTARPGAKVQRRFMPAHAQGEIFKAALRTFKAQDLVQDVVVGLFAEDLGDAVLEPTFEQLNGATNVVLGRLPRSLVKLTLLGVVYREEVAAPHAVTVLRDTFACDLTK
jgi:hypothetical protein